MSKKDDPKKNPEPEEDEEPQAKSKIRVFEIKRNHRHRGKSLSAAKVFEPKKVEDLGIGLVFPRDES